MESLEEFKKKIKVGDKLRFKHIVNFNKWDGTYLIWREEEGVNQEDIDKYFSPMDEEEYQHHGFEIIN